MINRLLKSSPLGLGLSRWLHAVSATLVKRSNNLLGNVNGTSPSLLGYVAIIALTVTSVTDRRN